MLHTSISACLWICKNGLKGDAGVIPSACLRQCPIILGHWVSHQNIVTQKTNIKISDRILWRGMHEQAPKGACSRDLYAKRDAQSVPSLLPALEWSCPQLLEARGLLLSGRRFFLHDAWRRHDIFCGQHTGHGDWLHRGLAGLYLHLHPPTSWNRRIRVRQMKTVWTCTHTV